ncbi:hypothetical protein GE09DRAFT_1065877 [Coniochaeta sp. 2T2.1]|nr:hypothetical protein GE09DRAFT_1065877 [Coniochaeta sp. 2T2.1]
MADLVPTRDVFHTWLQAHPPVARLQIFQLMDSLTNDYMSRGSVAPVAYFESAPELGDNAAATRAYLKAQGDRILQEMEALDWYRPQDLQALPLLPYSWAAKPLQEMLKVKDHENNHKYQMVLDHEHALELDKELHEMHSRKGKTAGIGDCDFPATYAERKALADGLFHAMVDTSSIVEVGHMKTANKGKKKATADDEGEDGEHGNDGEQPYATPAYNKNYKVARVEEASNVELQILAWKILDASREAQEGYICMPTRHGKEPAYKAYATYKDRYEAIKAAVKGSKSIIVDAMAPDPIRRLVAAPKKEYLRKKQNKRTNDDRNGQVKAGRKAMATGIFDKNDDGSVTDKQGRLIAPAPISSSVNDDEQGRKTKKQKTS